MSLSRSGVYLNNDLVNLITPKKIHKIRKIFSITTIMHNNRRKTINCTSLVKKSKGQKINRTYQGLIIPRFGGFMLMKRDIIPRIVNKLPRGSDCKFEINSTVIFTDNQKIVLDYLFKKIYNKEQQKHKLLTHLGG